MEQQVSIDICGQTLVFSAQGEAAEAEKVARYVEQMIRNAQDELGRGQGATRVAVVVAAALGIAADYFRLANGQQRLAGEVDHRCERLLARLDEAAEALQGSDDRLQGPCGVRDPHKIP